MLLAYVSGKYTDPRGPWFQRQHVLEAEQIAASLWSIGFAVICPHKNTEMFDGIADYDTFLRGDLLMVRRSHLLVVVPNWTASSGATRERNHALKNGVPVFHYHADYDLLKRLGRDDSFLGEAIRLSFEKLHPEECLVK